MQKKSLRLALMFSCLILCLMSCTFQPQSALSMASPLQTMYLQTADPYGNLAQFLRDALLRSNIKLTNTPETANSILVITADQTSQDLLSVNDTQQTRQYNLHVTVSFIVTNRKGVSLLPQQTITETRAITVQSNQILGSSNEATLSFQQMRRALANAIVFRLASHQVTAIVNDSAKALGKNHEN